MDRAQEDGIYSRHCEKWEELGEPYKKLHRYLHSFEFFQEVESLHFNHYMDGTDAWERGLDHIYRRSITPIHQMN